MSSENERHNSSVGLKSGISSAIIFLATSVDTNGFLNTS